MNLQEVTRVQQLRMLHTEYRDDFEKVLLSYLDEMQREFAMVQQYEDRLDGERHIMECSYLREVAHNFSIQGV